MVYPVGVLHWTALGFRLRYVAYEIDENATKVSNANYPSIEHMGDVTKADFTEYEGFDLLIGGSPCTYWSIARVGNGREVSTGIRVRFIHAVS